MKAQPKYNVILWDINRNDIEEYDIMPYLIDQWKELMKRKRRKNFHKPETFEEFKGWVKQECMRQFWARCEYEIIVNSWPVGKREVKIDAYDQILMNLDVVTGLFMDYVINAKNKTNGQ